MPKWITTHFYNIDYGWDYESKGGWITSKSERFFTPQKTLDDKLNDLSRLLDKNQYTIKAVIPKTLGLGCHDFSSRENSSYGWGYGVTPIVGFVVLAQHEREVSFEEYENLNKKRTLKKSIKSLQESCNELQNEVNADIARDLNIVEKRKTFGGVKYLIGSEKFNSREDAEIALKDIKSELEGRSTILKNTQLRIEDMGRELKSLENENNMTMSKKVKRPFK